LLNKLFLFFALCIGQGSILSWVAVHRTHHAFEDTDKDPHSPHFINWFKIYLAFLPKKYEPRFVIDLLRDKNSKYFIFENKYYLYMWIFLWIFAYTLNSYIFLFLVSGSALWYIATITVNVCLHKKILGLGYKSYNDAVAYNSKFINLISGVGYHNNHHKNPSLYSFSHHKFEIDLYGFLIKTLFLRK
jgi:stearoyl-CoA desaturase (delta-9 desaturase)